jgi:hypothetical protein
MQRPAEKKSTLQKIETLRPVGTLTFVPVSTTTFQKFPGETHTLRHQNIPLLSQFAGRLYSGFDMRVLSAKYKSYKTKEVRQTYLDTIEWSGRTNQRRHLRYPLRATIRYQWRNAHGLLCRGKGRARNVSEGGALIVGTNCPARGDLVDLTLRVPRRTWADREYASSLRMTGEVVRLLIDASGKTVCGFAVRRRGERPRKAGRLMNFVPQVADPDSSRCN